MKAHLSDAGVLVITAESGTEAIALHFWQSCHNGYSHFGEEVASRISRMTPSLGVLHINLPEHEP